MCSTLHVSLKDLVVCAYSGISRSWFSNWFSLKLLYQVLTTRRVALVKPNRISGSPNIEAPLLQEICFESGCFQTNLLKKITHLKLICFETFVFKCSLLKELLLFSRTEFRCIQIEAPNLKTIYFDGFSKLYALRICHSLQ